MGYIQTINKQVSKHLVNCHRKQHIKKKLQAESVNWETAENITWHSMVDTLDINDEPEEYVFFGRAVRYQHQLRYHTPFPSLCSFHWAVCRLDWKWLRSLITKPRQRAVGTRPGNISGLYTAHMNVWRSEGDIFRFSLTERHTLCSNVTAKKTPHKQ